MANCIYGRLRAVSVSILYNVVQSVIPRTYTPYIRILLTHTYVRVRKLPSNIVGRFEANVIE